MVFALERILIVEPNDDFVVADRADLLLALRRFEISVSMSPARSSTWIWVAMVDCGKSSASLISFTFSGPRARRSFRIRIRPGEAIPRNVSELSSATKVRNFLLNVDI